MTFDDAKRIISYEKDEVESLRYLFLYVFSDVLSDDVAPAHVKFQQYDDTIKEYVDLKNDQKLEQNSCLKAIIDSTKGKVSNFLTLSNSGHPCSVQIKHLYRTSIF